MAAGKESTPSGTFYHKLTHLNYLMPTYPYMPVLFLNQ